MPPEYFDWMQNLQARDTIALATAGAAAVIYLATSRLPVIGHWSLVIRPLTRLAPYALPLLLVTGLALRLLNLGAQSLWYDESLTALTAQQSVGDILTIARNSNHPPGYYLLMWLWSGLWWSSQPPEWWLRLPSALAGTGNIGLIYLVARQFDRPRGESLLAAGLMALLPFQIFYGQEARMYTLLLAAAQVALLGYLARRWWLVVVGATVMMYSQSMGGLFLATLGVIAIFDRRLTPLLIAGGVTAALYAPWAGWGLLNQIDLTANGWIPQVTPGSFVYLWHVLLWGETTSGWLVIPLMVVSGVIVIAAVVAGLRSGLYRLIGLMVGPPLLAVAASHLVAPVFIPRPLITVTPALYILLAHSIFRGRRWLLTGLLAGLLAIALSGYYLNPDVQKWPHQEWAGEIRERYEPGDAVFYVSHFLPFWWYLPDLPSCFLSQDDTAPNAGFNLSTPASAAIGMKLIDNLDDLDRYRRVFVLYARSPANTPEKETVFREIVEGKPIVWQHEFINDDYIATGSITLVEWSDTYDPTVITTCERIAQWDLLTVLKQYWVSANQTRMRLRLTPMPLRLFGS